jgi:hypothetical protein
MFGAASARIALAPAAATVLEIGAICIRTTARERPDYVNPQPRLKHLCTNEFRA